MSLKRTSRVPPSVVRVGASSTSVGCSSQRMLFAIVQFAGASVDQPHASAPPPLAAVSPVVET